MLTPHCYCVCVRRAKVWGMRKAADWAGLLFELKDPTRVGDPLAQEHTCWAVRQVWRLRLH